MGSEIYKPHSVIEYKGLKFGQKFEIDDREYTIYRIDDIQNQLTLIAKEVGFRYIDIDEFIRMVRKTNAKD